MKVVGKYTNVFSANLAKGMLENYGIEAQVLNENIKYTSLANTDLLSMELVVNDEDYSEACRLLEASSKDR